MKFESSSLYKREVLKGKYKRIMVDFRPQGGSPSARNSTTIRLFGVARLNRKMCAQFRTAKIWPFTER